MKQGRLKPVLRKCRWMDWKSLVLVCAVLHLFRLSTAELAWPLMKTLGIAPWEVGCRSGLVRTSRVPPLSKSNTGEGVPQRNSLAHSVGRLNLSGTLSCKETTPDEFEDTTYAINQQHHQFVLWKIFRHTDVLYSSPCSARKLETTSPRYNFFKKVFGFFKLGIKYPH